MDSSVRLGVTTYRNGGWVVVALDGEVDFHTYERMDAALGEAGAATSWVVVDCARLAFCDSSFLATLVGAHSRVQAAGGMLALVSVPCQLGRLLTRTGLDQVVAVYASAAEAMA